MAAALSRARLWPPRELLLLACALVQLAAAVPNPQQVLEAADSITDGVPVNSSAQLHQAVSALPPNQGIVLLLEGGFTCRLQQGRLQQGVCRTAAARAAACRQPAAQPPHSAAQVGAAAVLPPVPNLQRAALIHCRRPQPV